MRELTKITGKKKNGVLYPEHDDVALHCLVGVELEVENVPINKLSSCIEKASLWGITGDGSLRNSGVEILSVPMAGANLIKAMGELDEIVQKGCSGAEITERCSMHVHIDMRDVTVRQLINFLIVYTIFETELFKHVGEKRMENP